MSSQVDPTKPLPDGQREAFCVRVASGQEVFAAYKAVFGKGTKPLAFTLREDSEIDARIYFLQESRADRAMQEAADQVKSQAYSKDVAMTEATACLNLAMTLCDARAAVAAVGLKAKLAGLLTEAGPPPKSIRDLPMSTVEALLKEAKDRRLARLLGAAADEGDRSDVEALSYAPKPSTSH